MFKIRNIFIALGILIFLGSCASSPKGMRKKRKKRNCDCPSFGQLENPSSNTYYYQA